MSTGNFKSDLDYSDYGTKSIIVTQFGLKNKNVGKF